MGEVPTASAATAANEMIKIGTVIRKPKNAETPLSLLVTCMGFAQAPNGPAVHRCEPRAMNEGSGKTIKQRFASGATVSWAASGYSPGMLAFVVSSQEYATATTRYCETAQSEQ